jgi:hypothetical protein
VGRIEEISQGSEEKGDLQMFRKSGRCFEKVADVLKHLAIIQKSCNLFKKAADVSKK